MTKHVVLDRDGTLIEHVPYLCDPKKVRILPTVIEGLTMLRYAGCKLFLHTNQSGIGRGFFTRDKAVQCNSEMIRQLGLGSELFERICVAPEAPDEPAVYRKPSPKFGREIMSDFGITEKNLFYIGDNISDLLTATNLGCRGIGVNTALHDLREMLDKNFLSGRFPVFDSFMKAAEHIVDEY